MSRTGEKLKGEWGVGLETMGNTQGAKANLPPRKTIINMPMSAQTLKRLPAILRGQLLPTDKGDNL